MLLTIGLIFLILALADFVSHIHGPANKAPPCSPHDWYQLVDTEGKDQGLICAECKNTPSILAEEHVPNE